MGRFKKINYIIVLISLVLESLKLYDFANSKGLLNLKKSKAVGGLEQTKEEKEELEEKEHKEEINIVAVGDFLIHKQILATQYLNIMKLQIVMILKKGEIYMLKILVVEDDADIQDILMNYLTNDGYEVILASDGVEGISKFNSEISLVILDIMLPKIDGYGVCEVIRRQSQVPIIMLTALIDEENQIRGFQHEIDDYVPKPFSVKVLLYKITAILKRRVLPEEDINTITYRNLVLDVIGRHVYCNGKEIVLTQKEFDLLQVFLENRGKVFTRQMLLDKIWEMNMEVEERIVDSHIKNLRKKLNVDYIETIRGVGYRIDKEN